MTKTTFMKLNQGWNAEPNAPHPHFVIDESDLWLWFYPNRVAFEVPDEIAALHLKFSDCSRFRFTSVNDEAWYKGDCRFSEIAPEWGEFYEVSGDFLEYQVSTPWIIMESRGKPVRNFLFYFRDETFECSAANWKLEADPMPGRRYLKSDSAKTVESFSR